MKDSSFHFLSHYSFRINLTNTPTPIYNASTNVMLGQAVAAAVSHKELRDLQLEPQR